VNGVGAASENDTGSCCEGGVVRMIRIVGVISPVARVSGAPPSCKRIRRHAGGVMVTRANRCCRLRGAHHDKSVARRECDASVEGEELSSHRHLYTDESMKRSVFSKRASTVSVFLLTAILASCGGSGSSTSNGVTDPGMTSPPPVNSSTTSLTVSNNKFTPAHDSVAMGATLKWTWSSCTGDGYGGTTCASHSVQFDDGGPSSSIQSSGTFSRTFASAGTYTYHCAVHGAAMAGTVIVK
jgi:plastocyanin